MFLEQNVTEYGSSYRGWKLNKSKNTPNPARAVLTAEAWESAQHKLMHLAFSINTGSFYVELFFKYSRQVKRKYWSDLTDDMPIKSSANIGV